MTLSGFWSYVHADDDAEGGRIAQLGRDIAAQFELLTGESIELFLDRDSLEWGAQWRERIETSLAAIAFFVPVLTPRYFASAACRSELQTFSRRADQLGLRALLLPVLYADLYFDEGEDELVELARSFQWVDWRELRFSDRTDGSYRRTVHDLAQRLVTANRVAETPESTEATLEVAEELDAPGTLDILASYEESLPALTSTSNNIAEQIARVGQITAAQTPRLEAVPSGTTPFVWRLRVVGDLSNELASPAAELAELGEEFTLKLHDMDAGVRTIIETAPSQPQNRDEFCRFFAQVRQLSASAAAALSPLERMLENAAALESLSREIRPVIREMRQGVTLVLEAQQVMAGWVSLINNLDFGCGEAAIDGPEVEG
ncbi:toll/interleukin-1 receptor domain-containing protein [Agromyces endophyticus]|uniref:toll/interleukin-1 receptor domain-containing protein n=1 Tax=Agromyces sp. H17E-10 TaxID=2932244 RepID=UPI001FD26756|nr:toll/interleukin-1 receptor domain-containing protein [Agromyces sp. H17E-10]UOQ87974.1 toll/interleukin-1 receptor domain-containing protein [Agromyces sp. H17E-10]